MAITATSTYADAKSEYLGNINYRINNDVAEAQRFLVAISALRLLRPKRAQGLDNEGEIELETLDLAEKDARQFIAENDTSGGGVSAGVVHFGLGGFRD